jgi:glutamyl-tRNA synthetase
MVITRFAPSPTGYLHIGGLRTALFNYLWAKKNNGKFRLRIEDTDLKRNKQEATNAILEAFQWVGMNWDDEVVYQSERFDIYKKYIEQLLKEGKAYKCYLTPEELKEYREAVQSGKEPPFDIRKYREFEGELEKDYVIRFKAPLEGEIVLKDGVKGEVTHKIQPSDDFVIARSNGVPTYNFVVVVDDHEMGMSDIIRGDDHLNNSFKQILIYKAFNWKVPNFYHVPMIHNEKGQKLSKRDGAVNVMEYKKEGFLPEALLNFLVRLGWSHGDQEIFSMDEMIQLFDPKEINSSASRYNYEKLLWLNHHYIKNTPNKKIAKLLKENFNIDIENHDKMEILLDEVKDRAQTLKEMANIINTILTPPNSYNEKAVKKFIKENTKEILKEFIQFLEDKNPHLPNEWHELLMEEFIPNNNLKPKEIMPPLRICLNGDTKGIDLSALLSILGKEEIIKRVKKFIEEGK